MSAIMSMFVLVGLGQKDLFGEKGRDTRVLYSHTFFFIHWFEDICHACQKPLDLHRFFLSVLLGFHDILPKSFYPRIDNWIKRIHLPNIPIRFNMISKCDLQNMNDPENHYFNLSQLLHVLWKRFRNKCSKSYIANLSSNYLINSLGKIIFLKKILKDIPVHMYILEFWSFCKIYIPCPCFEQTDF